MLSHISPQLVGLAQFPYWSNDLLKEALRLLRSHQDRSATAAATERKDPHDGNVIKIRESGNFLALQMGKWEAEDSQQCINASLLLYVVTLEAITILRKG